MGTKNINISSLDIKRYWREGAKEGDCLLGDGKNLIPVEVKSSNIIREEDIKNLDYFVSKFKLKFGVLLYNGKMVNFGKIRAVSIKDMLLYGFYGAINGQ